MNIWCCCLWAAHVYVIYTHLNQQSTVHLIQHCNFLFCCPHVSFSCTRLRTRMNNEDVTGHEKEISFNKELRIRSFLILIKWNLLMFFTFFILFYFIYYIILCVWTTSINEIIFSFLLYVAHLKPFFSSFLSLFIFILLTKERRNLKLFRKK